MRYALWLTVISIFGGGCRCSAPVRQLAHDEVIVTPAALIFEPTYVHGGSKTLELSVRNTNGTSLTATVTTQPPFELAQGPSFTFGAAETVVLRVTFAPQSPAGVTGALRLVDDQQRVQTMTLTGLGLAIPPCPGASACAPTHFNSERGMCETDLDAEGTDCTATFACFKRAECHHGECLGTLTTCDDADPCTADVCGADGCGHLDDSASCPQPSSLCEAPICNAGVGCGTTNVADGTPCGTRTCSEAMVCITGQCVSRAVPANQACVDVVAGWPAGCGVTDGQGPNARLGARHPFAEMVYDASGNLYLAEASTIRRVSPSGEVRTIAGLSQTQGFVNGFGRAARLTNPAVLGLDAKGNLIVKEVTRDPTGTKVALRKVTPSGLVSSWVGRLDCAEARSGIGGAACLRFDETVHPSAVLEDDGHVTVLGSGQIDHLFRVSQGGSAAEKQVAPFDGGARNSGNNELSAGPHGVWVCKFPGLYELRPTGEYKFLERDCPTQVRNLGVIERFGDSAKLRLPDGGVELIIAEGRAADGPTTTAGVKNMAFTALAAQADGGVAVWDPWRCNIRRVENGVVRTLAGPVEETDVRDGSDARLTGAPVSMSAEHGRVVFVDGSTIRTLVGQVVTTVGDLDTQPTPHSTPFEISVSPNGEQLLISTAGPRIFDLSTGRFSDLMGAPLEELGEGYWASNGSIYLQRRIDHQLVCRDGSGAWVNVLPITGARFRHGRRSEGFVINFDSVKRFNLDGGTEVLIERHPQWYVFDVAEEPNGNVLYLDGSMAVSRLRLDVTPPVNQTVIELSDQPQSIAVSEDGGVYIGVASAILRLR